MTNSFIGIDIRSFIIAACLLEQHSPVSRNRCSLVKYSIINLELDAFFTNRICIGNRTVNLQDEADCFFSSIRVRKGTLVSFIRPTRAQFPISAFCYCYFQRQRLFRIRHSTSAARCLSDRVRVHAWLCICDLTKCRCLTSFRCRCWRCRQYITIFCSRLSALLCKIECECLIWCPSSFYHFRDFRRICRLSILVRYGQTGASCTFFTVTICHCCCECVAFSGDYDLRIFRSCVIRHSRHTSTRLGYGVVICSLFAIGDCSERSGRSCFYGYSLFVRQSLTGLCISISALKLKFKVRILRLGAHLIRITCNCLCYL